MATRFRKFLGWFAKFERRNRTPTPWEDVWYQQGGAVYYNGLLMREGWDYFWLPDRTGIQALYPEPKKITPLPTLTYFTDLL